MTLENRKNKLDVKLIGTLKAEIIRFTQPVLFQSLEDEFELPSSKYATPMVENLVLQSGGDADLLGPEK